MTETINRIDPNPDTIIILNDPTTEIAVWYDWTKEGDDNTGFSSRHSSGESRKDFNPGHGNRDNRRHVLYGLPTDPDRPGHQATGETQKSSIQYQVSSRHLMLASPWFKRALMREGWSESNRDADEAFLILMNILHLRNRQVPRTLSLELLAKIAVLIDYYECSEAVEVFSDLWTSRLKKTVDIPNLFTRDLVLWLCVSWVFRMPVQFEQVTRVAITQSIDETFDTLELPIPLKVTAAIDDARIKGIESLVSGFNTLSGKFLSDAYLCPVTHGNKSYECGCILLGALTKAMNNIGIRNGETPFDGLSFMDICHRMASRTTPIWYQSSSSGHYQSQHPCNLKTYVKDVIVEASRGIQGLNLGILERNG
ncbi:hypothetical protein CC78DRAFT_572744 [Lojkania enalia]|uniref:BTB domain-containing protein n=1 Tax=Lojkania enalia TaxID=147567 RepID=A0A9P4MXC3_9PLEO|nr:hypothetical protein CC78DRAFT_572744 [Didymosphaeria enalia]